MKGYRFATEAITGGFPIGMTGSVTNAGHLYLNHA